MKQLILAAGLLLATSQLFAQFMWTNQSQPVLLGGGMTIKDLAFDPWGNTYAFGDFTGNVLIGTDTIIENSTTTDQGPIVLVKYDPSGEVVWTKTIKGSSNNSGHALATDALGNIYVCGDYKHTNQFTILQFGNNISLTGNASKSLFVAKVDSAGEVQWARSILAADEPGEQFIRARSMQVLGNDVVISGSVLASVSIDGQTFNLNNPKHNQLFLTSFSINGDFSWFKHTDRTGRFGYTEGNVMIPGPNNSLYLFGEKGDSLSWDGNPLPNPGLARSAGLYIANFDVNGNLNWMDVMETSGSVNQDYFTITTDPQGDVILPFRTAGSTEVGDTSFFANVSAYLVSYSSNGTRKFVKPCYSSASGITSFQIVNLVSTPNGNIYGMGGYGGVSNILVGNDTLPEPPAFGEGYFLTAYDQRGNILGGRSLMDYYLNENFNFTFLDLRQAISDASGNIFLTTTFEGQFVAGEDTLDSQGAQDQSALIKFDPLGLLSIGTATENEVHSAISMYPNPARDLLHLEIYGFDRPLEGRIFNAQGQLIRSFMVQTAYSVWDVSQLSKGVYHLQLEGSKPQTLLKR